MNKLGLIQEGFVVQSAWFDLAEQGLIKVTGDDRLTFLNGQLTQDTMTLENNQTFLCAYCNPKGRAIALFRAFSAEKALYLITEKALISTVMERLRKFVLRADVTFEDVSSEWSVMGVQMPELVDPFPDKADVYAVEGDAFFLRMPNSKCRGVVLCSVASVARILSSLSLENLPQGQPSLWDAMDIIEGFPRIVQESSECFVPQVLNLDCLGGVSFTKGCYVGQEVVARMYYLGKSKQRMYPAIVDSGTVVVGEVLKSVDGEKIAEVIFTQKHEGATLVQVVCRDVGECENQSISLQDGLSISKGNYAYLLESSKQ